MTSTSREVPGQLAYPMSRTCPLDPPPGYRDVQADGPPTTVRLWDGSTAWLITRYDDARRLLQDKRLSADTGKPGFPRIGPARQSNKPPQRMFIRMDPPEHGRYRRMLTREFTPRRMEQFRPEIQRIVDDLLEEMVGGQPPVDLVSSLALPTSSQTICLLLGVPYTDHDLFEGWTRTLVSWQAAPEQVDAALEELLEYLDGLAAAKAAAPGDDLLSRLVTDYVQPGELSREDLLGVSRLLLTAGHETTANLIGLSVLTLLQYPDQVTLLRADPALVPGTVEELLRHQVIVHFGLPRLALEDLEVNGHRVRAGESLIISLAMANRDGAVFDDPDELDIQRSISHHLGFGYGIHQCLGQPLARLEMQAVLGAIFRRLPALRVAVPMSELRFKDNMLAYGLHELPVAWSRRQPDSGAPATRAPRAPATRAAGLAGTGSDRGKGAQ